ncbi:MAG TPA: hypothetical protein ENG94_07100 [Actinobacteria bacterium]|nr:hypothetical protein [Actinomycetota bacterium]
MAQITCNNCGEVFEEQEFCPKCGQWVGPIPSAGYEKFDLDEAPEGPEDEPLAPVPPMVDIVTCPSCGAANPSTNRHCEQCGARITQGPLPVAPQPMIRTTAGARALAVILGTVAVVALLAFAFNSLFGSKEPAVPPTSSTTSTTVAAVPVKIVPINWHCSSELNATLSCDNLFDGQDSTYWNDASAKGKGAEIEVTFAQPYALQTIVFKNVSDDEKFTMNYKVKGFEIDFDDLPDAPFIDQLDNTNRAQPIAVTSFSTTQITFKVTSTYESKSVGGKTPFNELAIAELEFWGRPTK